MDTKHWAKQDINQPIKSNNADLLQLIQEKDANYEFPYITPGKNLHGKDAISNRTAFGSEGIGYYTCDGKLFPSMDQVILYNQMYYDSMMIKEKPHTETEFKGRRM